MTLLDTPIIYTGILGTKYTTTHTHTHTHTHINTHIHKNFQATVLSDIRSTKVLW